MKNKFAAKITACFAGILFLCLICTPVHAAQTKGDLLFDCEYVEAISTDQLYVPAAQRAGDTGRYKYAAVYNSDWDKYSCSYVYNQLSEEERRLWDSLDEMCLEYLTGTGDFVKSTPYIKTTLSVKEMANVAYIFAYSNPQYYFLNSKLYYSSTPVRSVSIGVYKKFLSGTARAEYTQQVKSAADAVIAQAAQASSKEEALRILHDTIVNGVEYNREVTADNVIDELEEEAWFTQSAYSALCLDYTVCAGYSKAFEMVCNACDIDCIAISSTTHAWNKARIRDSWFNVDLTWADQNGGVSYSYFAKSDRSYSDRDHFPESSCPDWKSIIPPCTLDSGSASHATGVFPEITEGTDAPVVSIYQTSDGAEYATLTCDTPGAEIYYTTDGTEPSQAATRSFRYRGSFEVTDVAAIRAVAVCNAHRDSDVIDYTIVHTIPLFKTTVSLQYQSVKYSGSAQKPQVTITYNGRTLTPDVHYTVSYSGNTAPGTAYVTITGQNGYSGTVTKTFEIQLAAPSFQAVSVKPSAVLLQWNRVAGADGYYVYRRIGSGSYTHIATITNASTTSCRDTKPVNGSACTYAVKAYRYSASSSLGSTSETVVWLNRPSITSAGQTAAGAMTVKWNKNKKATGYQIAYTTGSVTKKVNVSGKANVSKVIASLPKGKTYQVKVRTCKKYKGRTYYSAWTSVKKVKITK